MGVTMIWAIGSRIPLTDRSKYLFKPRHPVNTECSTGMRDSLFRLVDQLGWEHIVLVDNNENVVASFSKDKLTIGTFPWVNLVSANVIKKEVPHDCVE